MQNQQSSDLSLIDKFMEAELIPLPHRHPGFLAKIKNNRLAKALQYCP